MTTLILDPEHYTGSVVHGVEVKPEIIEWCNTNLVGTWSVKTDYQELAPSEFKYQDDEKGIDIGFTMLMMVTQPAIEFEDENELVHFKLRWCG